MGKKKESTSLDKTVAEIKKKYGDDVIMMLNEKDSLNIESLPTGSIGIDHAIGIGGYPRGMIVEIFGPESSGKTTLALTAVAEAQKKGWACAYIDVECALDPLYAGRLGVDTSKLLISQPASGEDAMQIVDTLVRGGDVRLIVVDSVAMLTTRAELEGQIEDQKPASTSRLMSKSMRVLVPAIEKSGTVVIFINQIRMMMMQTFMGSPETTPGGKALKFAAAVRLDIRKINTIKRGEEPIGSHVKVKVVKNKVGPPLRVAEIDILYNEGVSRETEMLMMGEKAGVIEHTGAGYAYGDHKLGRGLESSRQFLRQNPEIQENIRREVLAALHPVQ